MPAHILNPELMKLAKSLSLAQEQSWQLKAGFVDAATATGAPPGGAPPMDPAMMGGGAPPMDPAMMGGGAPPMDPAMMGGGGMTPEDIKALVMEVLAQQGNGSAGAGAGGGTERPKMKMDVNDGIYKILKMQVLIAQHLGAAIPPSLLLGDPARDPSIPISEAAKDPLSAAASQQSAIPPIEALAGASPAMTEQKAAAFQQDSRIHRGRAVSIDPNISLNTQNSNFARALLAQLNVSP